MNYDFNKMRVLGQGGFGTVYQVNDAIIKVAFVKLLELADMIQYFATPLSLFAMFLLKQSFGEFVPTVINGK